MLRLQLKWVVLLNIMLFDEIFECVRINSFFILHFLIALFRVMKVLHEYVQECDEADYYEERAFVPLYRASRGKQMSLIFRFPNHGRWVITMIHPHCSRWIVDWYNASISIKTTKSNWILIRMIDKACSTYACMLLNAMQGHLLFNVWKNNGMTS